MELLLVRIDHFRDRATYVSELRAWLQELQIVDGRLVSMGDVQLLFVAASEAQNERLLAFYGSRNIDTNSHGERCVDKFIDVLGRKKVQRSSCKGFLEMNVLSPTLLQKVLVHEWQAEQEWMDTALATKRTKAFLEWKEAAKAARKERRKREGQEKQHEREVKKLKREQEAAKKAAEDAEKAEEGAGEEVDGEEEKIVVAQAAKPVTKASPPQKKQEQRPQQQQQQRPGPKKNKTNSKNKKRHNKPATRVES